MRSGTRHSASQPATHPPTTIPDIDARGAAYDGKDLDFEGRFDERAKSGVPGGFDNYDPHYIRLMYEEYRLMLASQVRSQPICYNAKHSIHICSTYS